MNLQDNPFYLIPHYPDFSRMQPEHVEPALRARLAEARQAVEALEHTATPTWSGFMEPLFRACEPVSEIWAFVAHMHSVMNNPAWREAHDRMQPEVVAFSLRVGQSAPLYRIALALRAADEAAPLLTNPRRRILKSAIRSAEHAGVGLEGAARERFNAIQLELAQRGSSYGNHVLDAIKSYSLWIRDPADIAGLPASLLCAAAQAAREAGEPGATEQKGPWRITLDVASSIPFLKHSRNRELRETLFRANATKASSGALDNSAHVEKILALRREMAVLLGFSSYADLSLSSKMAPSVAAVSQLSDNLAEAARPMARRERDELLAFAKSQGFADAELAPWDIVFWAERLRETRFNYSEEELRAYFQFPRVLEGLFGLAERLFGIRV